MFQKNKIQKVTDLKQTPFLQYNPTHLKGIQGLWQSFGYQSQKHYVAFKSPAKEV